MTTVKSIVRAAFVVLFACSFNMFVPAEASLSVDYTDGQSNPFDAALCGVLSCDSNGHITAVDSITQLLNQLSNVNLTFGSGGNGNRKLLRGSD